DVELQNLEHRADPCAFLRRRHQEVLEQVLAAVPPVLPIVPKLLEVLEDRRVAAHLALPQVVEGAVLRETRQSQVRIGEIDAPGVAGMSFHDSAAIPRGQRLGAAIGPRVLAHATAAIAYPPVLNTSSGTHAPWKLARTRTGRCSRATGPLARSRASKIPISLWPLSSRLRIERIQPSPSFASGERGTNCGSCTAVFSP